MKKNEKFENEKFETLRRLVARALDPRTPEHEAKSCAMIACKKVAEFLQDRDFQAMLRNQRSMPPQVQIDRSGARTHFRKEVIVAVDNRPRQWKDRGE